MSKNQLQRDIVRLKHILDEISEIEEFLALNVRNKMLESALERKYTIIGEACRAISVDMRSKYPEIPWANIISMRNVLVHEYYKVEKETLWDVAENKIPALKDWVKGILDENKNL